MSEFNYTLDSQAIYGATSNNSGSGLLDLWGDAKGFLYDGISIAGDLAGVVTDWNLATGETSSNASGAYANQYQPTDEKKLADMNSAEKSKQAEGWIAGVPNGAVILAGAALALGLLALAKGGR